MGLKRKIGRVTREERAAKYKKHFGIDAGGEQCLDRTGLVMTALSKRTEEVTPAWRPAVSRLQTAADAAVAFWATGWCRCAGEPPIPLFERPDEPTPQNGEARKFTIEGSDICAWFERLANRLDRHNSVQARASGLAVNSAAYRRALLGEQTEAFWAYLDVMNAVLFDGEVPATPSNPRDVIDEPAIDPFAAAAEEHFGMRHMKDPLTGELLFNLEDLARALGTTVEQILEDMRNNPDVFDPEMVKTIVVSGSGSRG